MTENIKATCRLRRKKLDKIVDDLSDVESAIRRYESSGAVDFGILNSSEWNDLCSAIFEGEIFREDRVRDQKLWRKIVGDLRDRYATRGEVFDESDVYKKARRITAVLDQDVLGKGRRRKLNRYLSQFVDLLQDEDLKGSESVISDLEEVRDEILTLQDAESSTVTLALEDIEACLHDLSASGSLERVLGYLSSAKTNLKRFKASRPPSGVVVFEDEDTEELYRLARQMQEFKRRDVEDAFDWSESKFYKQLRDLRRKCRVEVKEGTGIGSSPATYIFRGRSY